MTATDSGRDTIITVLAVLLAIPIFMMGIVMPLMALTGAGHMSVGAAGWKLLMPLIPITVFGTLGYVLYTAVGDEGERASGSRQETPAVTTLRKRYAEGAIDEEEFERRLERLQAEQ